MRLTLVHSPRQESLVDPIWQRAAETRVPGLPRPDDAGGRESRRLLSSTVPHLVRASCAIQRRLFYLRLLSDVEAPEAKIVSQDFQVAGDVIVSVALSALDAHGAEVGYDPEPWKRKAREIGTQKLERIATPAADGMPVLLEAGEAVAGALSALDGDPGAVPERLAAAIGSMIALLVWSR